MEKVTGAMVVGLFADMCNAWVTLSPALSPTMTVLEAPTVCGAARTFCARSSTVRLSAQKALTV